MKSLRKKQKYTSNKGKIIIIYKSKKIRKTSWKIIKRKYLKLEKKYLKIGKIIVRQGIILKKSKK
jgi:hypothetical protein